MRDAFTRLQMIRACLEESVRGHIKFHNVGVTKIFTVVERRTGVKLDMATLESWTDEVLFSDLLQAILIGCKLDELIIRKKLDD